MPNAHTMGQNPGVGAAQGVVNGRVHRRGPGIAPSEIGAPSVGLGSSACPGFSADPFFTQNATERPQARLCLPRGRAGVGFRVGVDALTGFSFGEAILPKRP